MKCLKSLKKNLKNLTVNPSEPKLLLFFIYWSTFDISSAVISPSRLDYSIIVKTGWMLQIIQNILSVYIFFAIYWRM